MTDDITTALETVRKALNVSAQEFQHDPVLPAVFADALAALSTIEAELTDLKTAFEAECKRAEDHYAWYVKALAERDEAVAALREIEWQAQVAFRGKVSAMTLLDIISRARLSTPKDPTPRIGTIMDGADGHTSAGQFVPTPKEPPPRRCADCDAVEDQAYAPDTEEGRHHSHRWYSATPKEPEA